MSIKEHQVLFDELLSGIETDKNYCILDAGSGRTSLGILTAKFCSCTIDAVVFPNDLRKINSIKNNVLGDNYTLIETDICRQRDWKSYDLVVAHLLLGEAAKFGNSFDGLLDCLLRIAGKYLMIVDYPEDPGVSFGRISDAALKFGYRQIRESTVCKEEVFKTAAFEGHYYKGLLYHLA